jgi:hypothetical protein
VDQIGAGWRFLRQDVFFRTAGMDLAAAGQRLIFFQEIALT